MSAASLPAAAADQNHDKTEKIEIKSKSINGQSAVSTTFTPPFEDIVGKAEARLKFIDEVGKLTPGVAADCSPLHRPPWFEPKAFSRAQQLYSTFGSVYEIDLEVLKLFSLTFKFLFS